MKKITIMMAACLCMSVLYGCGGNHAKPQTEVSAVQDAQEQVQTEDAFAVQSAQEQDQTEEASAAQSAQEQDQTKEAFAAQSAQAAQTGMSAGEAAAVQDQSGLREIPAAGMDITLPESWTSSGWYISTNSSAADTDLIMTYCVLYTASMEELNDAAGRLGEDSEEFDSFLNDNVNDMFIIFSLKDTLGDADYLKELLDSDNPETKGVFELEEIGKAGGWTFYNVTGEEVMRRSVPSADKSETMDKIMGDLPGLLENIRFYEPEEEPGTKAGSAVSFETVDFDGNRIDSKELFARNKYTMINLWMSWCTYCVEEMPALEEMNREFAENGGAIIGVMLDGDEAEELETGKEIRKETGVTYPILIPTAQMKEQLIASAYPTTIFVDSNGIVVGDPIVGMALDEYRERMEELLGGDPGEAATKEEAAAQE